ncbi:MAG: hypothetical protein HC841_07950 [Verrucomicrobiae bacterium]|nr:hypothetical protein [Verrucomicrobiae bacterium]
MRTEEPPFTPELPAEARRQPPRRVPEIEEFPPLAQREFYGRNEPQKNRAFRTASRHGASFGGAGAASR